jgi:glycosyltransferase involved in cell wall biosynthesis
LRRRCRRAHRRTPLSESAGNRPAARLRVVVAIQSFRPHVGGAELQLERLVPHLAERGITSEVITRASRGSPRLEPISGSLVRRTPLRGESPAASIAYVLAALVHLVRYRRRLDLVHAHGALSPGTIALGGTLLQLPCLVTVLGTGPAGDLARLERKPLGGIRRRLLARVAHFAALSDEARSELLALGVPPARIFALPNGVDLDAYRPAGEAERRQLRERLGLSRGGCLATFVGRLHPVKDVDTVLEATARSPRLSLAVVGDGPERRRLEARTDALGIGDRVTFLGQSSAVPDILRASDLFMLSSHGEGMSNALLEAMACGLPCLVSRSVGGARELLGDGRGMLLADGDAAAWADAVERVASDEALRSAMGAAAASFVARSLSLQAAADRLVHAYRLVAASRPGTS